MIGKSIVRINRAGIIREIGNIRCDEQTGLYYTELQIYRSK